MHYIDELHTNFKKANQDEQQNQTTATNINYMKILCPFKKRKLNNKVKMASDETEIKQKNL